MSYSEKLKDPRWQRKRLEVFNRDNFTCLFCASSLKPLNVHHVIYSRFGEPWELPTPLLQTVCELCHEERQAKIDAAANAVKIYLKDIPNERLDVFIDRLFLRAWGTELTPFYYESLPAKDSNG